MVAPAQQKSAELNTSSFQESSSLHPISFANAEGNNDQADQVSATSPLRVIEERSSLESQTRLLGNPVSGGTPTRDSREPGSPIMMAVARTATQESQTQTTLSEQQLDQILATPKFSTSRCTAWQGIQTQYAYTDNRYEPTTLGVATWLDLTALVARALLHTSTEITNAQYGNCLSFTLHDHLLLDSGLPTQECLNQLQAALINVDAEKSIEIILRGDALDPPQVIQIDASGTQIGSTEQSSNHIADKKAVLAQLAQEAPHLRKLFDALETAITETVNDQEGTQATNQGISLNEVLSRAIPHFNDKLTDDEQSCHVDEHMGRTKIVNFTQALAHSCERLALQNKGTQSPFDTLIGITQRQTAPGIYSIGGGQTLTLLLLAIQAMDCGKLPLDTRLEGDNRSTRDEATGHPINSAVAEIVEQNQRRTHLGKDLSIAQNGQCLIHMRPDAQRLERLRAHPPQWLLFNVPTNALKQVFTPQMMATLSTMPSAPIMVLSAKSFCENAGKVDVPATNLYQMLAGTPMQNQKRLLVLGGYFAAPWLATGSPVHFVVAGKDPSAVDSFANLMPDDQNGPIKHDRRYGKDQLFGTAIMGALKNQAVYTFARQIVQATYNQLAKCPEWTVDQHCSKLNAWADPAADRAIDHAEQAVKQLTHRESVQVNGMTDSGAFGMRQIEDFTCAKGVRTDFERCMVRPVGPAFVRFVAGLHDIFRQPTAMQGEKLRNLLAREVVDSGKGFGSRNSRDGVIDEALRIVYDAQVNAGQCESESFEAFRTAWTPSTWLAKTTEGRNGMLPVLTHLSEYNREVPTLIHEAAQYYGQVDSRLVSLANRARTPTNATSNV